MIYDFDTPNQPGQVPTDTQSLRLHFGELGINELRLVRAAIGYASKFKATTPDPAAPDGDAIAAVLAKMEAFSAHYKTVSMVEFKSFESRLRAALSKPRQSEAHPIGWVLTDNDLCVIDFTNRQPIANGWRDDPRKIVQAVYTAPPTAIPDGMVVVPEKMHVDADAWEAASFAFGGPATGEDETYMDCTLWVGSIELDEGGTLHGLHVSCNECPEEGSITLATFPAAAPGSAESGSSIHNVNASDEK